MKPSEGEWEKRYWDLVGEVALLEEMQRDGHDVADKWTDLLKRMEAHNMWKMANDMRGKLRGARASTD